MKKSVKRIICGIACVATMPVFCACSDIKKLGTPKNLCFEDNASYVLKWDKVDNADYYKININGKEYTTASLSFDASDIIALSGNYEICITACSFDSHFQQSDSSTLLVKEKKDVLSAPELEIQDNILTWNKVENADYYYVIVNGNKILCSENSIDLASEDGEKNILKPYLVKGQNNKIQVFCAETSQYKKSEYSNMIEYYSADYQETPSEINVVYSHNKIVLMFKEVSTATSGYAIYVDGKATGEISKSGQDVTDLIPGFGFHDLSIQCKSVGFKYLASSISEPYRCEKKPMFVGNTINNVYVKDGMLSFDEERDAETYDIYINDSLKIKDSAYTALGYDISGFCLVPAHYKVYIIAKTEGYCSERPEDDELYDYLVSAQLNTPSIEVSKNEAKEIYITIGEVKNAAYYELYFAESGKRMQTKSLINYINDCLVVGNNTITCKAVPDQDIYLSSAEAEITYNYFVLNKPTNLEYDSASKILTFNQITNIDGSAITNAYYTIMLDDVVIEDNVAYNESGYSLKDYISEKKKYSVAVRARYENEDSEYEMLEIDLREQLSQASIYIGKNTDSRVYLKFDKVNNADFYDIYVNNNLTLNNYKESSESDYISIDMTSYLAIGENLIYVISKGDDSKYLPATSNAGLYILYGQLGDVVDIDIRLSSSNKYHLFYNLPQNSDKVDIVIKDSNNNEIYSITNDNSLDVDIDSYITKSDTYSVIITAKSTNQYYLSKATQAEVYVKGYSKADYENQTYFYGMSEHTLCVTTQDELDSATFYAVLYRLPSLELYIDDSFPNFNATTSVPQLSNFGVDVSRGDVLSQLFTVPNMSNIQKILTLIEKAHDQIYLYYSATTSLACKGKSENVYKITFSYADKLKAEDNYEATKINATPNRSQVDMPVGYNSGRNNRVFAIDSKLSAPVTTVAQLLMVVQGGRKPQFAISNTIAEQTYMAAREVLKNICSDSMTDYQKALAIHDYIVMNNQYDDSTYDKAVGAPFDSSNLEEMAFYASGMLLNHLSVCKGISQAFALMCRIEGIQTVETFGLIGGGLDWSTVDFTNLLSLMNFASNVSSVGGHSWNRIKLDIDGTGAKWYIVDCTWDDLEYNSSEVLAHDYFLVTDEQVKNNRKELYPCGTYNKPTDEQGQSYNAVTEFNYYKGYSYRQSGTETCILGDLYISSEQEMETFIGTWAKKKYGGFEIQIDSSISSNYNILIQSAFTSNGLDFNSYELKTYKDKVFVYKKNN